MTIADRDDETFKQSLAELARRAGERLARLSAADPGAAAQARRAALLAHDRARTRRLRWVLGFAAGLIAGTGVAALVSVLEPAPAAVSAGVTPAEPVPSVEQANLAPAPASTPEVPSSSPEPSAIEPASPSAAPPAASASNGPAPASPAPGEATLQRDEVREVQVKLRSFGFNPGPIDGIAGRTTEGAVLNYQQKRELPQTGKLDRQLLEQLRQDPAPQVAQQQAPQQVAQRAARPDPRPAYPPPAARRSDPLQPLKDGLDRAGRWIDSLVR